MEVSHIDIIYGRVLHVKHKIRLMAYSLDFSDDAEGSYETAIRSDWKFNYLAEKEGVIP
jgi:hypothetical protein